MAELAECLGSTLARVFDARITIPEIADPVAWAIGLIRANAAQAKLQSTRVPEPGAGPGDDVIVPLDPANAVELDRFLRGVLDQQPMHGSLDLLQYGSGGGDLRNGADWVWHIARQHFMPALHARSPLGFYLKATLWLSAGEHRYAAHCDLADGFLIHLCGQKRVRVWPVPDRFRDLTVFDHKDFDGRMSSAPAEFELNPGQILFIPGSAMHDVVARRSGTAVSVSLHMGSPYPLLALCNELNELLGFRDISLPEHMQARDKFGIWLFRPADFIANSASARDRMPPRLAEGLLAVLQAGVTQRPQLRALLDRWWTRSLSSPHYTSPYP